MVSAGKILIGADTLRSFNTRMGTNVDETTTLQTFRKTVKRIPATIVPLTCSDFPRAKVTEWGVRGISVDSGSYSACLLAILNCKGAEEGTRLATLDPRSVYLQFTGPLLQVALRRGPGGTEITNGGLRMLPGTRTCSLMRERTASPASWSP